jgi:hypothetical protein
MIDFLLEGGRKRGRNSSKFPLWREGWKLSMAQ